MLSRNLGQSSLEYLLIIAGAIVVAVIVLSLLFGLAGSGSDLVHDEFGNIPYLKCTTGTERACGTEHAGNLPCTAGTQTCQADGTWDACSGVLPETENCEDLTDNDCDGYTSCDDSDCLGDPFCMPFCTDADEDGYALEGGICREADCDDDMRDDPADVTCPENPSGCTADHIGCAICTHPHATDFECDKAPIQNCDSDPCPACPEGSEGPFDFKCKCGLAIIDPELGEQWWCCWNEILGRNESRSVPCGVCELGSYVADEGGCTCSGELCSQGSFCCADAGTGCVADPLDCIDGCSTQGESQDCSTGLGEPCEAGQKTCQENYIWSSCQPTDPDCVSEELQFISDMIDFTENDLKDRTTGLIHCNLKADAVGPVQYDDADCQNWESGSETQCLYLHAAAELADCELVTEIYNVTFTQLYDSDYHLMNWRYNEDGTKEDSSAFLDDARCVIALEKAYTECGNQEYLDTLEELSAGHYQCSLNNSGRLTNGPSWDAEGCYSDNKLHLSYATLEAIGIMDARDSGRGWASIRTDASQIIDAGQFPITYLYEDRFVYSTNDYLSPLRLNMIRETHSAINQYHTNPASSLDFLNYFRTKWSSVGAIYDFYLRDGTRASADQDFSVYSLMLMLAILHEDCDFANELKQYIMENGWQSDGSVRWGLGDRAYSFGQTMTILAMAKYIDSSCYTQ